MTPKQRAFQLGVSWILLIVVAVTLGMSWHTSHQLTNYVQCQAEWNTFFHNSIRAARGASAPAQVALDELINAVSESKSREETRAALEKYKKARLEQQRVQAEVPLPPPPKEVCEL